MVKWQKLRNISATYAVRIAIIPRDSKIIMTKSTKTTFISARKRTVIVFSTRMQTLRFIKKEAIKEGPRVQCALSSPLQTTKALPTLVLMFRSENAVIHYKAAEHQQLIVDVGALPHLNYRAVNSVIRRAPDVITNLAHENNSSKTYVRIEGAIPPLVELLQYVDSKIQRAAAGALRTLAFKNDENKNQIVSCNALPTLVLMLRSEDAAIHYEAVGVIGNLVHSSPIIKKEVLNAGALQPVIGLLSSCCTESQREAALLLRQFAATDSDCKVHTVQRGAARVPIEILQSPDVQLREMAAFELGRLAQDTHNQAGIVSDGGLMPLLKLLESKHGPLQHNAVFALYGLADNEDNVSDFIKVGGVQKLQDGESIVQATKDCVARTLKRLEEKIKGRVLNHLICLMHVGEKVVQRRVALVLAYLCSPGDQKTVFIDNKGLELLLGLLASTNPKQQKDGSLDRCKLSTNATLLSTMDAASLSPTPQVYLGIQFVNNATLSDVTFLIEGSGTLFNAQRIICLASSDTFRAMFDGGYGATKDFIVRTLKRLEEKIKGRVLNHLIYHMRIGVKVVQTRVALALAHLCSPDVQKTVFIDNKGLELLLGLLASSSQKQQKNASVALCKLATKATLHSTMDASPLSSTPQVYLGIQFVNSATLSDVTFRIEGGQFDAHIITLLASSDTFRAMLHGGYRGRDARDIEIPNIRLEVFELLMLDRIFSELQTNVFWMDSSDYVSTVLSYKCLFADHETRLSNYQSDEMLYSEECTSTRIPSEGLRPEFYTL